MRTAARFANKKSPLVSHDPTGANIIRAAAPGGLAAPLEWSGIERRRKRCERGMAAFRVRAAPYSQRNRLPRTRGRKDLNVGRSQAPGVAAQKANDRGVDRQVWFKRALGVERSVAPRLVERGRCASREGVSSHPRFWLGSKAAPPLIHSVTSPHGGCGRFLPSAATVCDGDQRSTLGCHAAAGRCLRRL